MSKDTIGTVVLGFGPQPMDWISKAAKVCGKDAVMDPNIARMAGANLAAGTPAALALLRERLEAGALEAQKQAMPTGAPAGALEWLAHGERGMSSEALFQCLSGIRACDCSASDAKAHPYDPDDFRRCRLMLEAVPSLADKLHKARDLSPAWAALIDAWAQICTMMDCETPDWRDLFRSSSAPATYQLIQRAIGR